MKGHPPQWVCGVSPSRYLSTATPFRAPCPASGDTPWPEDIQRFFDTAPDEMAAIPEAEGPPTPPVPSAASGMGWSSSRWG